MSDTTTCLELSTRTQVLKTRNKHSSQNRKKQIYEESFLQQSQNRKKKKKVITFQCWAVAFRFITDALNLIENVNWIFDFALQTPVSDATDSTTPTMLTMLTNPPCSQTAYNYFSKTPKTMSFSKCQPQYTSIIKRKNKSSSWWIVIENCWQINRSSI